MQDGSGPFHQNDGELVTSFHRQIVGLGCGLFDPEFCPVTGCGQDLNQRITADWLCACETKGVCWLSWERA